jgi:hypothetical protein
MEQNKEVSKQKTEEEETIKPVLIIKKSSSKVDFMEPSPKSSSRISNEVTNNWQTNTKPKLKTE